MNAAIMKGCGLDLDLDAPVKYLLLIRNYIQPEYTLYKWNNGSYYSVGSFKHLTDSNVVVEVTRGINALFKFILRQILRTEPMEVYLAEDRDRKIYKISDDLGDFLCLLYEFVYFINGKVYRRSIDEQEYWIFVMLTILEKSNFFSRLLEKKYKELIEELTFLLTVYRI